MSDIAARYRKVAGGFTRRARAVPDGAWDAPAPCEGWVARDVVRHMVEWMPGVLARGVEIPAGPSVDDDPVGAWTVLDHALQAALDDPAVAAREFDVRGGRFRVDVAINTFCLPDVLVHTWDLARATGLDDALDPDEVHRHLVGMEPIDEILRTSGHYGPKVPVPADADEQTRLIAFTGRDPNAGRRP
ncbi:MAG: hypothetical protein JWL73_121 [Actinomycetia bacterium]|nr:hypothetical protein [Actinomycetes bacterium]